ncbi:HAMP domain-containing sensor histidine kinase [Moritella sp.]|uniref:sensor histidine kinase n=1 Tax=Moritella sp. TaxID=78556 RepID=UPI0025CCFDA5|nr:HAMP domain-containing sensor histidine kinase [Moritella sp.]MCJ8351757.1 HAMP domain-containing histidine kinase [Moritella sp.]
MSHRSLLGQITFPLIILFVTMAAGLFFIYCAITDTNSARVEQTLHKNLAQQIIHYSEELQQGDISRTALKPAFHSLMLLGPSYEIYITDNQGKLLVYAAESSKIKRDTINIKPLDSFIKGVNYPIYADNPRSLDQQKLFSTAPIFQNHQQIGYVFVILGGDKYDSIVKNFAFDSDMYKILTALVIFFALAFALLVFIFARLVRPISQLDQDITNFVRNDFTTVSTSKPHQYAANEIINLHNNFSSLENKIHKQLTQIKSTEQLRREMLSHISHDLKTPLASLKGYLETWLIQHPEAAGNDFIQVAQKNANQLQRLVEQIIELAQLDSNTVSLYQEPVAVAELAQDVLNKFQLQAQQKDITLSVEPKDPSLQAIADIAKLERVFTNLVDNALRHCQSGDSIKIHLQPKDNQLIISITDSGVGIPKEDVAHIFDAHFRAKNTVNGQQGNSGLGLAIVAKLLSLHHAKISVSSVLSQGTTFSFSLPTSTNI